MQIQNIKDFIISANRYFFQSSWQGKTIQILGAVSFLSLIYYVAFRSKKLPSKNPADLSGRAVQQPSATSSVPIPVSVKAKPAAPIKADIPYIKTAIEEPGFLEDYFAESTSWLSEKMKTCEELIKMAKGEPIQQGSCSRLLRIFIPEQKAQVEEMVAVFNAYPEAKAEDLNQILKEWDSIADPKAELEASCTKLGTSLTKLETCKTSLQDHLRGKLMQQLSDVEKYPHYDFTDLQTHYFHYLGLHEDKDFSRLLGTRRNYLAEIGLFEMTDVDLLQLRTLQPSIEKLRQLFCLLTMVRNEEKLLPLIQQEIQKCKAILHELEPLMDILKNGQELRDNVNVLNKLFDGLAENFAEGLSLLKKIEQQDISRQLLQLKGYIHQQDHLKKWEQLRRMEFIRLASYVEVFDLSTFILYQIGTRSE
jgi:hypothetical protein